MILFCEVFGMIITAVEKQFLISWLSDIFVTISFSERHSLIQKRKKTFVKFERYEPNLCIFFK